MYHMRWHSRVAVSACGKVRGAGVFVPYTFRRKLESKPDRCCQQCKDALENDNKH